jgi:hypothetical protein
MEACVAIFLFKIELNPAKLLYIKQAHNGVLLAIHSSIDLHGADDPK